MEAVLLLNRIIEKGGLIGMCAKMYENDNEKAGQFIRECSQQCHNVSARNLWGEELALEIISFSNSVSEKEKNLEFI